MCGLVGVAGDIVKKDLDAFGDLLTIDQIRGPHSTGVASVDKNGNHDFSVFKRVGGPQELMEYKNYDRIVSYGKSVLLGHNRFATMGGVKHYNAHPFGFRHIVGAHNGTLPHNVHMRLESANLFDTDSEALFCNIEKEGVQKTVDKLTAGAYCLVWYDQRDNTINFIRNDQRPLWLCVSKSKKSIYWASEPAMLLLALGRRDIEFDSIEPLPVDVLTSYTVPGGGMEFAEPFCRPCKPAPEPVRQYVGGYRSLTNSRSGLEYDDDGYWENGLFHVWEEPWSETKTEAGTDGNVVTFPSQQVPLALPAPKTEGSKETKSVKSARLKSYKAFGEDLDQAQFEDWTKGGCVYCEGNIHWGDAVRFLKADGFKSALCNTCFTDDAIVELVFQGRDAE